MTGLETLIAIRKVQPKLPVIMFSSLTERGAAIILEVLSLGASDYLTKPANTGSLEQTRSAPGPLPQPAKVLVGIYGDCALRHTPEAFKKVFPCGERNSFESARRGEGSYYLHRLNLNDDSRMVFMKGLDLIFCCYDQRRGCLY